MTRPRRSSRPMNAAEATTTMASRWRGRSQQSSAEAARAAQKAGLVIMDAAAPKERDPRRP